jgi:hypothetical protein
MASISETLAMSELAYEGPNADYPALLEKKGMNSWELLDQSGSSERDPNGSENGYFGVAFRNKSTGEIVVANRGSRLSADDKAGTKQDWLVTDVGIAKQDPGNVPKAFDDGLAFSQKVMSDNPGTPITYTGHSLGGGQAQVQAAHNANSSAQTFAAPGMKFAISDALANQSRGRVVNYRLPSDPVTWRGDHIGETIVLDKPGASTRKDAIIVAAAAIVFGPIGGLIALAAVIGLNHLLSSYRAALGMAGGGPLLVIDNLNLIICTGCPKPQPLKVTMNQTVFNTEQLAATIADCIPMVNILPFGPCAFTPLPPSPSGGPCIPKPVGMWKPGSMHTTDQGIKSLRQVDTLQCGSGGTISITYAGQNTVFVK